MLLIEDFEKFLKKVNNPKYLNQYDYLIKPFRVWLIKYLNNNKGVDMTMFLNKLPDNSNNERERYLYSFERYYFDALPYLNIEIETVYETVVNFFEKEIYRHNVVSFCMEIVNSNIEKAKTLYDFGSKNNIFNYSSIAGNIMLGLYRKGNSEIFDDAKRLFNDYPLTALFFFGRVNFKSIKLVKSIIHFVDQVDLSSDDNRHNSVYFYENLIKQNLSKELNELSFGKLYYFFDLDEKENLRWRITHSLTWSIKGFEKERYQFLNHIIERTKNINVLRDYFVNFEDPKYFFELFYSSCKVVGFRTDVSLFRYGFEHFIRKSFDKTEIQLLSLITDQSKLIRISVLRLMIDSNCNNLNLLKIETELGQLRAVEAIMNFPHSFKSLLPMLIDLRNSKFDLVIDEVQNGLCNLILNAYKGELLDWVKEVVGSTKEDKEFLKPLEMTFNYYIKIKELKDGNKHLDPLENERSLVELYYRLEDENKAEMMNEISMGKGSFLAEMSKSIIVVRGNSWKLEGKKEITPLSLISSSSVLDSRAFKNPDLFESNLNNPNSKY